MDQLNSLGKKIIDRYSQRFQNLGIDVRTLGWGSVEQQRARFYQALSGVNDALSGQSILDIGCGFADLLSVIEEGKIKITSYTGWDINPDLIAAAKSKHKNNSFCELIFDIVDISTVKHLDTVADVGFMLGLLNLNFHEAFDNLSYSKVMLKNAFSTVKNLLVVDFLSTRLTPDYPKEDFIYYHDPVEMLEYALTLTPKVVLRHDYAPIPQREFMLFLYK